MKKVFLIEAKRTAIGKFGGSLATVSASDMAAEVIKTIISNTGINPADLDEVITGNVLSAGQRQGVSRQAAIKAGIPNEVPAYSLNMVCGSGMKAVSNAVSAIRAGEANLILAGGTEAMSGAPMLLPASVRTGTKMGDFKVIDHMILDGLWEAFNDYHMGNTAENIAEKYNISREEQDQFAFASQTKAAKAQDAGNFKKEIIPINIVTRKETIVFDQDEFINRTTDLEKLAKLLSCFQKRRNSNNGNASGINDGASYVLVASEELLKNSN